MLYTLYHQSGKYRSAERIEALNLIKLGGWYDATDYRYKQEKLGHDEKSILKEVKYETEEPKQPNVDTSIISKSKDPSCEGRQDKRIKKSKVVPKVTLFVSMGNNDAADKQDNK